MLTDINSRIGANSKPDVIHDRDVIYNLLTNIFATYLGTEKFEEGHGTRIEGILQENISQNGAEFIRMQLTEDVEREIPFLAVSQSATQIRVATDIVGYDVYLVVYDKNTGESYTYSASLERG